MVRPKAKDSCWHLKVAVQVNLCWCATKWSLPGRGSWAATYWNQAWRSPVGKGSSSNSAVYVLFASFCRVLLQQGVSSTDPSKWLCFTYHQWSTSSSHCLWIKVEWTSQFGRGSWSLFSSLFLAIGSSKQAIKQMFEILQHLWGVADRCLILQAPWHCWFWRPMISRWMGYIMGILIKIWMTWLKDEGFG